MLTNPERNKNAGKAALAAQVRPKRPGHWRVAYQGGMLVVGHSPQQVFSLSADPSDERDQKRLKALIALAQAQSPLRAGGLSFSREALPFHSVFMEVIGPAAASVKTWVPDPLGQVRDMFSLGRLNAMMSHLAPARLLMVPALMSVVLLSAISIEGSLRSRSTQASQTVNDQVSTGLSQTSFKAFPFVVMEKVSQELLSAGVEGAKEIGFMAGSEGGVATLEVMLEASLSAPTLGVSEQNRQERIERARRAIAGATGAQVEINGGRLRARIKGMSAESSATNSSETPISVSSLQDVSRRYGVVSEVNSSGGVVRLRLRQQPIQAIEALLTDPSMQHFWRQVRLARGLQRGLADFDAEIVTGGRG